MPGFTVFITCYDAPFSGRVSEESKEQGGCGVATAHCRAVRGRRLLPRTDRNEQACCSSLPECSAEHVCALFYIN
jgi:hypothetical protein